MRILMLTSVYPQPDDMDYKTTPTVAYFCKEWVKQGHDVVVIHNGSMFPKPLYHIPVKLRNYLEKKIQIQFPRESSCHNTERDDCGVKVYRRNMLKYVPHAAYSAKSIERQGKLILQLLRSLEFVPDVIIGHWANPQAPLISWLRNNGFPESRTGIVFHNDCEVEDVNRYSLHKYIQDIDAIGCRNQKYGRKTQQNLNLKRCPFICNSGIPNTVVENANIDLIIGKKSEKSVLFVGRLVKYKKLESILMAISNVRDRIKLSLLIVGEGAEKESVEQEIEKLCLNESVEMKDRLPRDQVFDYMAQTECFTLISENEVFGMVYLEAMLMGCITIATRGCAVDGIILDGVNGFLCKAGDSDELTRIYQRIDSMTKDEKVEMMKKAHETAKLYSDENVAKKYLTDVMNWQNTEENNANNKSEKMTT